MSPALATPPPPFIKAPYPGSKSTPGSIDASPCQLSTPINCASLSVPRIIGSFMWFQSRGLSRALSSSDPSPRSKLAPLLTSPVFSCGPLPLIIRSESVMSTGIGVSATDMVSCKNGHTTNNVLFAKGPFILSRRNKFSAVPKSTGSSSSDNNSDQTLAQEKEKVPFGYSRKDVLLIGLGVTLFGIGLKSGLEYGGVDPLQAGNVVQLVLVLGLTVGWISTYMFRVSNKDMTYAQQLRDYEKKVMEKRLEGLTEAELEALLEQVEEEKRQVPSGEQV